LLLTKSGGEDRHALNDMLGKDAREAPPRLPHRGHIGANASRCTVCGQRNPK
jgi:hypothetical protein